MMDPEMEMITLDSMGHAEAVKRTAATATAATAMTSTSTTVESSTSFIASSTAPLSPARLSTSLSSTSPSIPHPIPAATLSSPSYRRSATAALSYNIKNRSNTIDKIRLLDLGYSEQLGRSLDFWSSCSIGICNIGMLPGVFFGATTALTTGGSSMYSIAFPLTGICLCAVVAVLGEMSSTFPVAGTSSWHCSGVASLVLTVLLYSSCRRHVDVHLSNLSNEQAIRLFSSIPLLARWFFPASFAPLSPGQSVLLSSMFICRS